MAVVVLDGHRMVGQAVAGVVSEVAGLPVQGVCASVPEARALIQQAPPRLLVLDVELGGESFRDAVDLLRLLRADAELLFITALGEHFSLPVDLVPITIAVVDKSQGWDQLLSVLQSWWRQRQDLMLPAWSGCDHQLDAIEKLSPREQRVIRALGCGLLNKEIAARLQLSLATVETYRKSVAAKLGVSGAELVRLATLHRVFSWGACASEGSSPSRPRQPLPV